MNRREDVSDHPNVMVSSTYQDLSEHREAVTDALLRLGFFPLGMEFDSSQAGKDVIVSSLEKVDGARAYIGIVSHRYGGVPEDAARNPDGLSITELEYRRALERDIPVYMFLMSAKHPVTMENVESVEPRKARLLALRQDAESRSICKQFSSVGELKGLVLQAMAELRGELSRSARVVGASRTAAARARQAPELPRPPQLLAVPDFISGHDFVGRATELEWLDEWAAGGEDPLLVVEAIGGMGKSTLAWQWVKKNARAVRPDFAGVLWYSFYEGGADMSSFAAYALAYTTGQPLKKLRGRKTAELTRSLVAALKGQPFLLVLDGLERVLVAYHRLDASQARDDQVLSDRDHRACIKPADEELLRQLLAAGPSKFLVTSRLLPTAFTNNAGQRLPGVAHRELSGLHTDDALSMMRELGVRGGDAAVRRYLEENFENHPLLVGIVAGLVNDYPRDPGNFDRWAEDPQGGAALSLAALPLKQRRTHILAAALSGLEPGTRQLLSRIAALADAVPFDTITALNPFLPAPPPEPPDDILVRRYKNRLSSLEDALKSTSDRAERKRLRADIKEARARVDQMESERATHDSRLEEYRSSEDVREALNRLVSALRELGARGLLQWDRKKNTYDLHPVVRGYAFDVLEDEERTDICNLIVDHFQSKPADRYAEAKTVADVQQSINIARAFIQAGRLDEAASFISGDFIQALIFSVETSHEVLALLHPLFPGGFRNAPHSSLSSFNCGLLMNYAAVALLMLNRYSEARVIFENLVRRHLEQDNPADLQANLGNLGIVYMDENRVAQAFATQELSLEFAEAAKQNEYAAVAHLSLSSLYISTGQLREAETAYEKFRSYPLPNTRTIYRQGIAEELLCDLRLYQGTLSDELLDEAEAVAQSANNRLSIRGIRFNRGELALRRGDLPAAVASFEAVVEMTHKVGLPVADVEARLALAKARQGEHEYARAVCERLRDSETPPHVSLAEIYLETGNRERARHHALEGYRRAWADGPPYSLHWEMERCRAVLNALGEPEPEMPAFDPKAVEPVPHEKEIRALISKLRKKRK